MVAGGGEGETVPAELERASDESREAGKERMIATHRSTGRGSGGPGQGRVSESWTGRVGRYGMSEGRRESEKGASEERGEAKKKRRGEEK